MDRAYFQSREYVDYLRQHCMPGVAADRGRVVGTEFIEHMLASMDFQPGEKVLEIGCGLGRVMQLLEQVWGVEAWGCDVSVPGIEEARRVLPAMAPRFFVSPAEQIAVSGPFDRIVTWGVFEMTEQRLALVEMSRLLKVGGSAMLCAVKNRHYFPDDASSRAAHRAYIAKSFPITYCDLERFESLLGFLGLGVRKRLVFDRKDDITRHAFRVCTSPHPPQSCCDIYYIVEKQKRTPLDDAVQFRPSDVNEPGEAT